MELGTFFVFAMTTLVVVLTPGPAAIAVATQASANGLPRSLMAIIGVALANAAFFLLSATGISASIIASETIFTAMKWFGVLYLSYLGISALISRGGGFQINQGKRSSARALLGKGFLVEIANPKALLFFAAILPQFLDISEPIIPQMMIMGATTLAFDLLLYSGYAVLGAQLASRNVNPAIITWLNRVAGGALLYSAFRVAKTVA